MTDEMHTARLDGIKRRYEPGPPTRTVTRNPLLTYTDIRDLITEVERLRGEVQRLESSKLLAASMMAEQFCEGEVERLREQVEVEAVEAKACEVTELDPCPWHPDGGNHPESAR